MIHIDSVYIGEFPPPFGGVTIKNRILQEAVFNDGTVQFFNLYECKRNPFKLLELIVIVLRAGRRKNSFILGLGSPGRLRKMLIAIRLLGGKESLGCCTVIMMGSTLHKYCAMRVGYIKMLKQVKCIYTESHRIEDAFRGMGIDQVAFFPNCRAVMDDLPPKKKRREDPLRLVFFSKICREKGLPLLFEVARLLEDSGLDVIIDFYGEIQKEYKDEFEANMHKYSNCRYLGVFDSTRHNVYRKLHQYHALIFPTEWKSEGVAGILVESKLAGITAIVSRHNYNDEVVKDGVEGIVIPRQSAALYYQAVWELLENPEYLFRLSRGAYESASRYDIVSYCELLRSSVRAVHKG